MKIESAQRRDRSVHAVKTHNRVVLLGCPNAPLETALAGLRQRRHIKNQAAHFAEEFLANVIKMVVRAVEAIGVDEHHFQEAFGNVL